MASTQSKTILQQIFKYISLGYTIAYEMKRFQSVYITGNGHERVLQIKKNRELKQWRDAIRQLKRSKFITDKVVGERLVIALTNKARRKFLVQQINTSSVAAIGKSTLVIYDVPEGVRGARDELRLFLKNTGFKQMQKSVWYLNKNVVSIVNSLISELKIRDWVRVFLAEVIN